MVRASASGLWKVVPALALRACGRRRPRLQHSTIAAPGINGKELPSGRPPGYPGGSPEKFLGAVQGFQDRCVLKKGHVVARTNGRASCHPCQLACPPARPARRGRLEGVRRAVRAAGLQLPPQAGTAGRRRGRPHPGSPLCRGRGHWQAGIRPAAGLVSQLAVHRRPAEAVQLAQERADQTLWPEVVRQRRPGELPGPPDRPGLGAGMGGAVSSAGPASKFARTSRTIPGRPSGGPPSMASPANRSRPTSG